MVLDRTVDEILQEAKRLGIKVKQNSSTPGIYISDPTQSSGRRKVTIHELMGVSDINREE